LGNSNAYFLKGLEYINVIQSEICAGRTAQFRVNYG
jgi:hypothetical protein